MNRNPYDILIKPLITEKSTALREQGNKVCFFVSPDSNRIEVKKAVEEALKVKVEKVNIISVHGKIKRFGRFEGKKPERKKAIVTLKEGEKIELLEGV
jgi:large subunit ribosomal protein L23